MGLKRYRLEQGSEAGLALIEEYLDGDICYFSDTDPYINEAIKRVIKQIYNKVEIGQEKKVWGILIETYAKFGDPVELREWE